MPNEQVSLYTSLYFLPSCYQKFLQCKVRRVAQTPPKKDWIGQQCGFYDCCPSSPRSENEQCNDDDFPHTHTRALSLSRLKTELAGVLRPFFLSEEKSAELNRAETGTKSMQTRKARSSRCLLPFFSDDSRPTYFARKRLHTSVLLLPLTKKTQPQQCFVFAANSDTFPIPRSNNPQATADDRLFCAQRFVPPACTRSSRKRLALFLVAELVLRKQRKEKQNTSGENQDEEDASSHWLFLKLLGPSHAHFQPHTGEKKGSS